MPTAQFQSYNFVNGATAVPPATETVIAITKAVSSPAPSATFGLMFSWVYNYGAGGTGVNLAVRRGSLTGTLILAPPTLNGAASVNIPYFIGLTDQIVGEGASLVWVLTATTVGGAAAASVTQAFSSVIVAQ